MVSELDELIAARAVSVTRDDLLGTIAGQQAQIARMMSELLDARSAIGTQMEIIAGLQEQAAVYREMGPLLDRLHALTRRRGWPLGQNILKCAVEELERLTPSTTH